ncbi:hypothetical protein NUSPORA_01291 [Nucleospora cyclopteri]
MNLNCMCENDYKEDLYKICNCENRKQVLGININKNIHYKEDLYKICNCENRKQVLGININKITHYKEDLYKICNCENRKQVLGININKITHYKEDLYKICNCENRKQVLGININKITHYYRNNFLFRNLFVLDQFLPENNQYVYSIKNKVDCECLKAKIDRNGLIIQFSTYKYNYYDVFTSNRNFLMDFTDILVINKEYFAIIYSNQILWGKEFIRNETYINICGFKLLNNLNLKEIKKTENHKNLLTRNIVPCRIIFNIKKYTIKIHEGFCPLLLIKHCNKIDSINYVEREINQDVNLIKNTELKNDMVLIKEVQRMFIRLLKSNF